MKNFLFKLKIQNLIEKKIEKVKILLKINLFKLG